MYNSMLHKKKLISPKPQIPNEESSSRKIWNSYIDVCDFKYLTEVTGGKKHLIKEIIDAFLTQVPKELQLVMQEKFFKIK